MKTYGPRPTEEQMRKRLGAAFKCAEPVLFNYRGRYYVEVWIVRLNHLVWGRKEQIGRAHV